MAHVGVITFHPTERDGYMYSPLVYTTGAHDDWNSAHEAGRQKAAAIFRRVELVREKSDETNYSDCALEVAQSGSVNYQRHGVWMRCVVSAHELTDEIVL
jgi:hypothetical protein